MARTTLVLVATGLVAATAAVAPTSALGSESTPTGLHRVASTATTLSLAVVYTLVDPETGARHELGMRADAYGNGKISW